MTEIAMSPPHAFHPSPAERVHLEAAHHEVCTATTVVVSNVELLRQRLGALGVPVDASVMETCLTDLDSAAARLHELAKTMRIWHGRAAIVRAAVAEADDASSDIDEPRGDPFRVSAQLRATAAQLGFTAPPVAIEAKLFRGTGRWTLLLRPEAETPAAALVAWTQTWDPLHVAFGSRHMLRADFHPVPPAWKALYRRVDVDLMRISPDGNAWASVSGTRAAIATFTQLISRPEERAEVLLVKARPDSTRLLTPAQDEAIRTAAEAGYYQIPRPLTLVQLAKRLHITSASLSERLRRAEARVITRFLDDGASSWADLPKDFATSEEPSAEWSARLAGGRTSSQVLASLSDDDVIDQLARAPPHAQERELLAAEARLRLGAVRRSVSDAAQALEADLLNIQAIVARSVAEAAEKDYDRESFDDRNAARESALEHIQATEAIAALERTSRNLVKLRGEVNARARGPGAIHSSVR